MENTIAYYKKLDKKEDLSFLTETASETSSILGDSSIKCNDRDSVCSDYEVDDENIINLDKRLDKIEMLVKQLIVMVANIQNDK